MLADAVAAAQQQQAIHLSNGGAANHQYGLTGPSRPFSNTVGTAEPEPTATKPTADELLTKGDNIVKGGKDIVNTLGGWFGKKTNEPVYTYDDDGEPNKDKMLYLKIAGGILGLVLIIFVFKKLF